LVSKKIRSSLAGCLAVGLLVWPAAAKNVPAPVGAADLSGTWQLNRGQSEFPNEVAFGPQWQDTSQPASGGRSGGGGRRRGGSGGAVGIIIPNRTARPESEEDVQKIDQLMDEVKNPSETLTITQTEGTVTTSVVQGVSRTFRTNGKEQVQQLKAGPMVTTSAWESGKLVVDYHIEKDRRVRYAYARRAGQAQLQIDVQLLEKGKGAPIKRVYDAVSLRGQSF
jgi:hypothetical protein